MKRRILFIEPDLALLRVYANLLSAEAERWEVFTATTASQALKYMSQSEFAVVVSDVDLPGISGEAWMREVRARCGNASRIIVSEIGNQDAVARCLNATHQFLPKPFEVTALKYALSRVGALDSYLQSPSLKALVSRLGTLPSLPSLYVRIMKELRSANPSLEAVAAVIGHDPSMAARILQIVNSASIGLPRRIGSPLEAVQHLGLGTVRSLVLAAHIFSSFTGRPGLKGFSIARLWSHATRTGVLAQRLMQLEDSPIADAEDANIAGMLHDIGKLILANSLPAQFQKAYLAARKVNIPLHEAEQQVLGANHAGVAAYLFGLWGMPSPIVEAVAFHHAPALYDLRAFCPLTAVHAADVLEHELSPTADRWRPAEVDTSYLASLGLEHRLDIWRAEAARLNLRQNETGIHNS